MKNDLSTAVHCQDLADTPLLPRVGIAATRSLNRLYARQPACTIALGGHDHTLHWAYDARSLPCGDLYRFRVGPHCGYLGLDAFAGELVFGGEHPPLLIPMHLRYVLLADKLFALVELVQQLTRLPFEWIPTKSDAAGFAHRACAPDAARFVVSPVAGGRACEGFIQFDDAAAFEPLLAQVRPAAPASGSHLDRMRLSLSFDLGSTSLSVGDMRCVQPDDIIRIDSQQHRGSALCVGLVINGSPLGMTALVDGARLVVQPLKDHTMASSPSGFLNPPSEPDAASGQVEHLDGLEVLLRFEVGALPVSLRELKSIGAGHVFELPEPLLRSAVRIVAHGNVLGKGHLVAVGDRLGVRVTEFAVGRDE